MLKRNGAAVAQIVAIPISLRRAIEEAERRYISLVTAWEIQINDEKHKTRFNFGLDQLEETMKASSCKQMPVEYDDIRRLDGMMFFHTDPFDRLLMSQAALRPVYFSDPRRKHCEDTRKKQGIPLYTVRPRGMGFGD